MAGVITEIAIECGVSEQAVRAWCRRNHVAKDAKGSFAISESQKTAIYQHYLGVERKQVSQPAKASCETCETTLIAMLQEERSFTERLTDGIGRMLDFLEEHLPERLRPLLEKARELLPDPEIGQQQEQQQHQRGMGGMEL